MRGSPCNTLRHKFKLFLFRLIFTAAKPFMTIYADTRCLPHVHTKHMWKFMKSGDFHFERYAAAACSRCEAEKFNEANFHRRQCPYKILTPRE